MRWIALLTAFVASLQDSGAGLKAGAAKVDITPRELPVVVNGSFLTRTVGAVADRLHSRALVLSDGKETVALAVVDSCMVPTGVCDKAKRIVAAKTGIALDRILISATHTHSAPSAMDMCLGTDRDPKYTEYLPGAIAESIIKAHAALRPARAGWTKFDASAYTKVRRWSLRPGAIGVDPFGERTVRANMHPGYQNPNATGETGPADPWFTLLSVQDMEGVPLALLGNFSMHYFSGHAGLSADYFGLYCKAMEKRLAPDDKTFVAALSQGTSGDIWRADYGGTKKGSEISMGRYADELAELSEKALEGVDYESELPLAMAENRQTMRRRVPDEKRLAWARAKAAEIKNGTPRDRPQVYARQAIYLHENPTAEVVLQALRLGDFAITAMPNEVYALTGLKLKLGSPLGTTMNLSLANGAEGYIPPAEQFPLGGYNTWPSVTAGLEVTAETKITDTVLGLLEEVAGAKRIPYEEPHGNYVGALRRLKPVKHWRLGGLVPPEGAEVGVVPHLPGVEGGGFPDTHRSRSAHFAGGRIPSEAELGEDYSVSLWFFNGLRHNARPVTGYLFSRGPDGDADAPGDHLGIGGTALAGGRLLVFNGNKAEGVIEGRTPLERRRWYHLVMVRAGGKVSVYLDGKREIEGELPPTHGGSKTIFLGGRSDRFANFEGRLDEAALFDRALSAVEVAALYETAGVAPPPEPAPQEPPLSPAESLKKAYVPDGFEVELVAAEPLVMDPVAVDWAADGSVWVAEMADYPGGAKGGPGRVVRLVDEDGDRKLDKRQVLLPKVAFPTGVMALGKGVIVSAAGEIFYAEDEDGDGVADLRETWFRGFIEGNQQLRVNGLRWGIDGWIYCASGGHHAGFGVKTVVECVKTGEKVQLGSRDFRFRPDGSFEPVSGPSQFGRVCDNEGNWFGVQNAHPLWHYVLDDRYLARNPDVPAPDPRQMLRGKQPDVFAASKQQKRFHGFDHVGRYTSACGISVYRDEVLFPKIANKTVAFTCEPFSNLVQRHVLTDAGPTFTAERAPDGKRDFFASEDRWCRPVMSRTAPDGSLWVVDMYRYMIEHPQWLPPAAQAEMRPFEYEGQGMGRIYRVTKKGATHAWRQPDAASPNGIARDLALREGQADQPAPAFDDPDPGRRRQALVAAEGLPALPAGAAGLAVDEDPKVRLQAAFTFGEFDDPEASAALAQIALRDGDDPFFAAAVLSSAIPHYKVLGATASDMSEGLVAGLLRMAKRDPEVAAEISEGLLARPGGAGKWRLLARAPVEFQAAIRGRALSVVVDPKAGLEERIAALGLMGLPDFESVSGLLAPGNPVELQSAAVATLGRLGAPQKLLDAWRSLSPTVREAAESALLSATPSTTRLLDRVEAGEISPIELSATSRERLLNHKSAALKKRARDLFAETVNPDRAKVVDTFKPALAMKGDPDKGRDQFAARCAVCHQVGHLGRSIGPDLIAVSDRSPEALLVGILDPSRSVEPRYLAYTATLMGGESVYGMVASETANSVVMHLLDGSVRVLKRGEIESLEGTGQSAMPAGLEAGLKAADLADLLAFLARELPSGL